MGKRKHDETYYKDKIQKLNRKLRKLSSRSPTTLQAPSPNRSPIQSVVTNKTTPPQQTPPLPETLSVDDAIECGSSSEELHPDNAPTITEEEEIPPEYLHALGDEGAEKEEVGDPIQSELALRWGRLLQNGLGKEAKAAIIKKYPTPSNFPQAIAPKMNPEIKIIMPETSIKRDYKIIHRQNLTGKLLNCLGKSLSKVLKGNINTKELIEEISDGAKIASEIFYEDSSSRKFLALTLANKNIRENIKNSKTEEFLFGTDCGEKIKNAQALKKTGDILKLKDSSAISKIRNASKQPTVSKQPGNWKGPLRQLKNRYRSGPSQQRTQQPPSRTQQISFRTQQRAGKQPAKAQSRPRQ